MNPAAGGGRSSTDDARGDRAVVAVSAAEAARVWARIGFLSFGGPAGQIALMHRILVEEKRWISEARFLHALNFCMLLPGPEAQQLATYAGWALHGTRGGLIAGTLFVAPGAVVVFLLSWLYVSAGSVPLVQGLFAGLKPAVVVIVLEALIRIARRSLDGGALRLLAAGSFIAMYAYGVPFPYVILAAALLGVMRRLRMAGTGTAGPEPYGAARSPPVRRWSASKLAAVFGTLWLAPTVLLAAILGPTNVFAVIGAFFSKMAVVTFGGAYAVLAYVGQEAVGTYAWLAPGEMIDGLALAETTPGPLILVTQFVGFIAAYRDPGLLPPAAAGFLGGLLTTWVTFSPCFLWILIGAPYMERLRANRALSTAMTAITAAVVGVIANLALWFTLHALFAETFVARFAGMELALPQAASLHAPSLLIAFAAAVLLFRFRASVLSTLAFAGALGMLGALL